MRGVQYVVDDQGHPKAVLIDLKKYGKLWEDFQDLLVSRERLREPRESLEEVEARLVKAKKLTRRHVPA
jgi:PHD/YefM family antitoxin component YafN of YafNO toxin-antitoxin module